MFCYNNCKFHYFLFMYCLMQKNICALCSTVELKVTTVYEWPGFASCSSACSYEVRSKCSKVLISTVQFEFSRSKVTFSWTCSEHFGNNETYVCNRLNIFQFGLTPTLSWSRVWGHCRILKCSVQSSHIRKQIKIGDWERKKEEREWAKWWRGFLSNAQSSPNISEIGSRHGGDGWQRQSINTRMSSCSLCVHDSAVCINVISCVFVGIKSVASSL